MFNLPRKPMRIIQVWVCVLLTFIALALSFMPIIKLKTVENTDAIKEMMSEIGVFVEIPKEVEVSAVSLVKSGKMVVDIVAIGIDAAKDEDKAEEKLDDLKEKIQSEDGINTFMTAMSIATIVVNGADGEEGDFDIFSFIFNVLIVLIAIFGVLGMTIALPITMIVKTIKTLASALGHIKNPEKAVGKIGELLLTSFSLIMTLMVFQTLIPGMSYGSGLVGIFVVTVIAAVLNTLASRLYRYSKVEFAYLNIVQGVSVVGIIGFLVFFFNMIKANVFGSFLGGSFAKYLVRVAAEAVRIERYNLDEKINNAYIIDAVAILITWILLVATISYFIASIARVSCTQKKSDCSIGGAIIALIVAIIPKYLMDAKHGYKDVTSTKSEGDFSFLDLHGDEEPALKLVLVGAIIMLVAEIALIVLKKVLCRGLAKEQMKNIISGNFVESEPVSEVVDKEASNVEEAPAVEETSTLEEVSVVEETLAVEETSTLEEVSAVEEAPVTEEIPVAEETEVK